MANGEMTVASYFEVLRSRSIEWWEFEGSPGLTFRTTSVLLSIHDFTYHFFEDTDQPERRYKLSSRHTWDLGFKPELCPVI